MPETTLTAAGDRVARLHAALPQTQCTRCGYPDCLGYARALDRGEAGINQCPPGGQPGVARLAAVLGVAERPLDPAYGEVHAVERVAAIIEADCIGCTKCIQACPVDAIIGGANHLHVVLTADCTGCELCIPPCPVDCIEMVDDPTRPPAFAQAARALSLYEAHQARLQRWADEQAAQRAQRKAANPLAHLLTPEAPPP